MVKQTVPQLQRAARRAELRLAPATAQVRHERALADRSVRLLPCSDGMAQLSVLLAAPEAESIFTRLTAATGLLPAEDERTVDQQRADLLVDAVLSGLPHDALPELQGRRPSIQVLVSADTLLGLDEAPAELAGYGPITAETARRLAADASGTWRRLLTDPNTGQLLDVGARSYRPAQRLRVSLPPATGCARSRPATSPATAANTSTPCPTPKVASPAATTGRWPAADTTSARTAPAGTTNGSETAATAGPPAPATPTPATHPNAGPSRCRMRLQRWANRHKLRVAGQQPPRRSAS